MALPKEIKPANLLKAANQFIGMVKQAQTYQYSADPMKKALDSSIGKTVENLAAQTLNTKAVSSLQININYQSPTAASFSVFATGTDKDAVEKDLSAALNRLAPNAAKIMSRFQKDPMDYKYAEYEK